MNTLKHFLAITAIMVAGAAAYAVPRPEYPRPQFERTDWVNLNGEWDYTLDLSTTGWERHLWNGNFSDGKITVPFAPESRLSGVEHKDFIPCIWYKKDIDIPAEWAGKDISLNFGAVYYRSEIYIDGKFVTRHFGGSDSFCVDITKYVTPGSRHSLVVSAINDLRRQHQPSGKQSARLDNYGCMYTRTTGIWQTVWVEAVASEGLARVRTITDIDRSEVSFQTWFRHAGSKVIRIRVLDGEKIVAKAEGVASDGSVFNLPIKKAKLWSPDSPFLYDVVFEVLDGDGKVVDSVKSYFGMRKIHVAGNRIYLNNQPFYQRLVLDQGFYPDGVWTAPSDDALRGDIEMSMAVGFNGARLHQKVFEERFLYWADKLGYLTWSEFPSWGMDNIDPVAARNFLSEWSSVVMRSQNHPSIVTWTPFNEAWSPDNIQFARFISDVYDITKALDPTRPVNTVSGGVVVKTDIWTMHHYEQDPARLKEILWDNGRLFLQRGGRQAPHKSDLSFFWEESEMPCTFPEYDFNAPYVVDEFGGIRCMEANPAEEGAWGYGTAPQTKEEFYERLEGQVRSLMELSDYIWGFCYTQLTDVQQEQNGIYYFDRRSKYDPDRLKAIFQMSEK